MYTGPNVTNDNLVFGYDTGYGVANTAVSIRFYKGKPATNLASGLIKVFGSWNNLVGTTEYYTRNGSQGVRLVVTSGGGVHWHSSNQINNVSSSTQYTISATVKWNGVTPHPNLFYIRQYNSSGNQVAENGYFSTSYMIDLGDGWYRAYRTFTTTSTTDFVKLQGYQYAAGADIYYQDEQFELGALTPYTGDGATRSNTTSLIDLKRTESISVANVSFDSTGQPEFDGTDDYIDLGSDVAISPINQGWTAEYVFNSDDASVLQHFNGAEEDTHNANWLALYQSYLQVWDHGASVWKKGSTVFSDNTWYHVAFVQETGTSMQFYVNGVAEGGDHASFSWSANRSALNCRYIGMYEHSGGYSRRFNGHIAIARLYDAALTAAQIKQNYNAYKKRFNI